MNSIETTISELIDAGIFEHGMYIFIILLAYYLIYSHSQRVRIAIADDAFDMQNYFDKNLPDNFMAFVKICEIKSVWRPFKYIIWTKIVYNGEIIFVEDSPVFRTVSQVNRYRDNMLGKDVMELCTEAHNRYMENVIDELDGGNDGQS